MFKLEIDTANAAFGDTHGETREALARMLRSLADRLERHHDKDGAIFDANGNRVGKFDGAWNQWVDEDDAP